MIITKVGRCIFPLLKFNPINLNPSTKYSFSIDFVLVSPCRFRFKNGNWVSIGIDKRKHLEINNNLIKNGPNINKSVNVNADNSDRGYDIINNDNIDNDTGKVGSHWMNFGVGFPKIKLTNRPSLSQSSKKRDKLRINNNDTKISHKNYKINKYTTTTTTDNNNPTRSVLPEGHFCLTSFHKYQPRICMIKYSNHGDSNDEKYFTFEKATFIAVTHYQNETNDEDECDGYDDDSDEYNDDLGEDGEYEEEKCETFYTNNKNNNEINYKYSEDGVIHNINNSIDSINSINNNSYLPTSYISNNNNTNRLNDTNRQRVIRRSSLEESRIRQTNIYQHAIHTKTFKNLLLTKQNQQTATLSSSSDNNTENGNANNDNSENNSQQQQQEQKVRQRKLNSCISLPSVKLYYSSTNNKNTTTKSLPSQTPPLLHSSPHPSSSYQQNQRQNSYFPQISNHSNQWNQEYYQLSTPVTPATSTTQNIPISTNDITDYCDFQYIRERYGTEAEKEADFVVADWN
nr:11533_t:CDS:2 [Entrophospora candida]